MEKEEHWWSKQSPNHICHYTTAEALLSILGASSLRLGPFRTANDPYEFELWVPSAIMGNGPREQADATLSGLFALQSRINRVAFAMDDSPAPLNHNGLDVSHRGFGSLPMWAHYGDRFRGACLVFDRTKFVNVVIEQLQPASDAIFHREISYCEDPLYLPTIGIGEDPAAYLQKHEADVLFRKRTQWKYESEFRVVTVSKAECPQSVKFGDALVGVIIGAKSLLSHRRLQEVYGVQAQGQMLSNGLQTIY